MPVRSNIHRRKEQKHTRSERSTKSLSPQKSKINGTLNNIKNNSVDLTDLNGDSNSNNFNQSDHSYSSILKQLHSDFNKKYISDNVTMDSKLRWNRDLQQSPSQNEGTSTPKSVLLLKAKRSPQIPSPLYSPIKPRKKPKENTQLDSVSMTFETPPSSYESDSPKMPKQRKKNNLKTTSLSLSHTQNLSEPIYLESNSPKNSKQKEHTDILPFKSAINFSKIEQNITKEPLNKTKPFSRKMPKPSLVGKNTSGRKNRLRKMNKEDKVSQYFVEEEHYNMENILETESEKSDFPLTRSPASVSVDIVSTPSPNCLITEEILGGLPYFSKEKSHLIETRSETEFVKNYTKTLDNMLTKSKPEVSIEINTLKEAKSDSNDIIEHSSSKEVDLELEPNVNENCAESSEVHNLITNEVNTNKNELEKLNLQNSISIDNQENTLELQENSNPTQSNEVFHYPALHNRISSLKSPMSMDSAHGSSIDVETNYHPKHCEIFWGRKGNFPYWPCLIWPDPEGKTVRIEKQGYRQYISYHVKFFADNGQRSWIYKDNLIAYNGREDFERRSKEQSLKMKNSIFKKYFVVSRAKLPIWDQAVKEADKVLAVHIEKRAEIFNEVLEESMELLKMHKQQRRLSLSVDRGSSLFSNNSVMDSNEDLLNTSGISSSLSTVSKRRRSSSLYENLPKRQKNEFDSENLMQHKNLTATMNNNSYSFPKELIEVMADYALKTTEDEENLQRFENCCIELFHIVKDSMHEEYEKSTNIKKHPNRMLRKNLVSKLKKQYIQIISKPSNNVEKIRQKRATLDAPSIQVVLKDIIDLLEDKQYLFRNLKKGPVCCICLKSDDLYKCSGHCDSWIHKMCSNFTREEYLEKTKVETKKKKAKKPIMKNEIYQHKVLEETDCIHITGDDEENSLNKKKQEEIDFECLIEVNNIEANPSFERIVCKQCSTYSKPFCFVCKLCDDEANFDWNDSDSHEISKEKLSSYEKALIKCKLTSCNKYYHMSCLKMWPQAYIKKTKDSSNKGGLFVEKIELVCPIHTCHTCVSENPHRIQLGKNNIIKCVKCPATYHFHSKCIPAGTQFLTANVIICPRHDEKIKPTNTDWCFLCSESGDLICCDTCPSAFHLSCLKLNQTPKDKFLCELCQNGCLPLYGDLVWCKFSHYKWWPSVIIPPPIIPKNLFKKAHLKLGFCVRFLGTSDYGWTGRHRVYLYQEDDYSADRKKDKILQKAIDEAKVAWDYFEINKPKRYGIEDDSTPLPYKKIKNNLPIPPVKLEYDISELNPCNCLPDSNSPCGYNSQCLNRVLLIECNPKICPAKLNCENQMFEKRQYAPVEIRKTTGKGFGLICTSPILAGTFIIEYVGEIIDDEELKRRIEEKQMEKNSHYYFFSIESNLTIDAGPKGNLARFMNHSCEPNCEPQMWTVNGVKRIGLFAKYDIKEETELTFHYNFECVGDNKISCHCAAENCKGFIGGIYNKKSNELKILSQEKENKITSVKASSKTIKSKQIQEK